MTPAIASRRQGFRAGPQDYTFYACAEHRTALDTADPNFFLLRDEPIRDVPEDDEHACDFCREGGA